MPKVVTVGEILVEVMAEKRGQKFSEPGIFVGPYPSGAPAIFLDQVARMGVDCGIVARVGDDGFGRLNTRRLKQDGADTSRVLITDGYTTGTAFVTYDLDGRREFLYHFAHSAAGRLSSEDLDEDYFQDTEYLHVVGCSLSASRSLRKAIMQAVEICKDKGAKISFDPNIRPELLGIDEIKRIFDRILERTDILLSGHSEFEMLFEDMDFDTALSSLLEKGLTMALFKNGAEGTNIYTRDDYFFCPAFEVEEVDPTGAGDCFDGAFIAALVEGREIEEAAEIASAAGALGVTKMGPMEGAAHREDVFSLIESQSPDMGDSK